MIRDSSNLARKPIGLIAGLLCLFPARYAMAQIAPQASIPEHACESGYGSGWAFERELLVKNEKCVAFSVSGNAHLDDAGDSWDFDRPFGKRQYQCVDTSL